MLDKLKEEMEARKRLAEINLDAETHTCHFCSVVAKQKKKVRLAHLRRKRVKTKEKEKAHPGEEFYEDLFTQDAIMEKVCSFYKDL